MTAPLPENEIERLAALHNCGLLDTDPEEGFDDITLLAAQICGAPMAAITLIDEHRQWLKSRVGLAGRESPRETAFCAHTILQPGLMVVADAEQDTRFADNPFVTGEPHIRFYAGTPLVTAEGHALGSLCVVDRVPRTLSDEQLTALRALGRQATAQILLKQQVAAQERLIAERKAAEGALREFAEQLHTTVEAMQEGLTLQDASGAILVCNPAAERILGLTADQVMGRTSLDPRWRAVREDGSHFPGEERPAMCALRTGEAQRDVLMGVYRPDGDLAWVLVNASPLFREGQSQSYAVVVTFSDVTDKKQAEDARTRLAAIVDSSSDAIVGATLDGTIVSWNRGAEHLYGYPPAAMIGNHASVLVGPDEISPVPHVIRRLRLGEDVPPMEVVRRRTDGTLVNVLLSFSPIKNAAGEMIGLAGIGRDITAQKQTEEAIRRSETRLADAQRIARIGSWEFDPATDRVEWSEEMFRIYGCDPAGGAPSNLEIAAMYHPDDIAQRQVELACALTEGISFEADRRIVTPDGALKYVHTIGNPVLGPDHQVTGLFGTVADVTERRQAEDALRKSEEALRTVMEGAPIILYATDAHGVVTLSEGAGLARLGLAPGEVVGRSVFEMYRDVPEIPGNLARALAGETVSYETVLNGLCYRNDIRPQRDEGGRVTGLIAVAYDLTDRRQAEEALREAEEKYRGIFENAIDGIFQSVPEGRFVSANPALAHMLGYASPEELLASLTDVSQQLYVDPGEREKLVALTRARGTVLGFEVRFRRKDGSILWASMNVRLVRDSVTGQEVFEGSIEDITARRAAEEQTRDYAIVLEVKMRELEEANAELERLATTDGLTGLLNHRAFQERLNQEFRRAERYGTSLSLLMLDVDAFKQFNDAYGHPAGDVVLREVADVLRAGARDTDIVARYGGEEFVMILPLTDAAGTRVVAERIRAAVEAVAWELRPVTVSIGACTAALHTDGPAALIACADHALYGSKAGGRNRVTYGCGREPQPKLG